MKKWNELCLHDIEDSHVRAMLELQYANYQLNKWLEQVLKSFNISNEQFNVLKYLEARDSDMPNLKDIQMNLPNQTKNTTRLVEKLKQKGLVYSQINPTNKRELQIRITQEGLALIKQIEGPMNEFMGKLKSALTEEESLQLSALLAKFYLMEG